MKLGLGTTSGLFGEALLQNSTSKGTGASASVTCIDSTYWERERYLHHITITFTSQSHILTVQTHVDLNSSPEGQGQANQQALKGCLKEQDTYPAVEDGTPDV